MADQMDGCSSMSTGFSAMVNGAEEVFTRPHMSLFLEYWVEGQSHSQMSIQGVLTMSTGCEKRPAKASMSSYMAGAIQSSGSMMETHWPWAISSPRLHVAP